ADRTACRGIGIRLGAHPDGRNVRVDVSQHERHLRGATCRGQTGGDGRGLVHAPDRDVDVAKRWDERGLPGGRTRRVEREMPEGRLAFVAQAGRDDLTFGAPDVARTIEGTDIAPSHEGWIVEPSVDMPETPQIPQDRKTEIPESAQQHAECPAAWRVRDGG